MKYRVLGWCLAACVLLSLSVYASGEITAPGDRYQTQCSTNLVEGAWMDLGNEFVAITNATTKTTSQNATECYFRVVKTDSNGTAFEFPPPPSAGPPSPPPPPAP